MVNSSPTSLSACAAPAMTSSRRSALDGQHGAELVAAQPVGLAVGRDRSGQLGSEAGEQGVAGGMAEGVVVALEAVEVEEHQQARSPLGRGREPCRPGRRPSCGGCPVRSAGRVIACSRSAWWPRMSAAASAALADELGQQRDLVVLEGSRAAREGDGAAEAVGRRRRRRAARAPSRHRGGSARARRWRSPRRRRPRARARRSSGASSGRQRGSAPLRRQVAGVGVERLDRAAQHDVDQCVEVELGRERVAHAAHGRLQPAALADRELQAALGLLDARAAVAGQQHEQPGQREDEQHRGRVAAGGEAREEADRRQAGVDHPRRCASTWSCSVRCDTAGRRLAQGGGPGVEDAAAQQRRAQQGKVREVELRRAGEDEHDRPARPRAMRRGSRTAVAARSRGGARGPRRRARRGRWPRAAAPWPAAAAPASGPGRAARAPRSRRPPGTRRARRARTERRA